MVEDYLSEEEQAEALKQWWRENWAWVAAGIVVGLALLSGWQYYQRYRAQRGEAAATALDQYAAALGNDKTKADALLQDLTDKYATTPYSDQARLLAAQNAVAGGDFVAAAVQLREVMEHGKDAELRPIARLRLARVLIQQGKADEALSLLDIAAAGAFVAQTHEARGDALYAKNDLDGARREYQSALTAYEGDTQVDIQTDVSLLKLKLSDLGVEADAVADHAASSQVSAQ